MPPLDFIPELMDIYPDAKVVLVTRDPERWLESIRPVAQNASLWWLSYTMWAFPAGDGSRPLVGVWHEHQGDPRGWLDRSESSAKNR